MKISRLKPESRETLLFIIGSSIFIFCIMTLAYVLDSTRSKPIRDLKAKCEKSHCESPLKPSFEYQNYRCVCTNLATTIE